MPSETREWSVPPPVRTLLWWPALSFALVVLVPDAATGAIVFAGAALAALGAVVPMALRRWRGQVAGAALDAPTVEFPALELPPLPDDRAA